MPNREPRECPDVTATQSDAEPVDEGTHADIGDDEETAPNDRELLALIASLGC